MKKIIVLLSAVVMVVIASACSSKAGKGTQKMTPADLAGKWMITELNGKEINTEMMPYIEFDTEKNSIHAMTGCNLLNATYVATDNKLAINMGQGQSTLMACPNMEIEDQIRAAMGKITNFVRENNDINIVALKDEAGTTLLQLERE